MNILSMKALRKDALDEADSLIRAAETEKRDLHPWEKSAVDRAIAESNKLTEQIRESDSKNTIRRFMKDGMLIPGTPEGPDGVMDTPGFDSAAFAEPLRLANTHDAEYGRALHSFLQTGGKSHDSELVRGADGAGGYVIPGSASYTRQRLANGSYPKMSADMYEGTQGGSDAAGGYAISVPTVAQIVPLALPDMGIFDASMVIPTATDVKIPQQASFGTSALKAESTGTLATFGGTDPTLGQITLSAFMVGALRWASWELLQDAKVFQQFIVDDLLKGQRIVEGQLLASGTGSAQPLGVFGNTDTGTGTAYELTGANTDGQVLLNALMDVVATLKPAYQPNASWVMARATGLAIRKAQMQANLYIPIITVDPDGTERILGKPVFYDVNAPALPTATSAGVLPILYGDFKQGYIIGVRGGAGVNVKILDQPQAAQGLLGILAYRRLDGRVRRSEAIQSIKVSHS